MSAIQIIALGVAAVAVLGMVAVFTIAWRREAGPSGPGLDRETRRRDRSEELPAMVSVPVREREEEAEEPPARIQEVAPPPAPEEAEAVEPVEMKRVEEVSPEEAGVTRRQFFNRALLAAFGTYLALVGTAMLAFFWPRLAGGFGARIDAGDLDDIRSQIRQPDGSVTPAYIPEARAYIIPFPEGEVQGTDFEGLPVIAGGLSALWQRCVHLGCRVPWCQPSQGFECPCHGSRYNLHGEYESGPAPRNLDRFRVEATEANRLIVHTADIIQTPRAQEKTAAYPQGPSCITIGG